MIKTEVSPYFPILHKLKRRVFKLNSKELLVTVLTLSTYFRCNLF